jgi:hypothetical protein
MYDEVIESNLLVDRYFGLEQSRLELLAEPIAFALDVDGNGVALATTWSPNTSPRLLVLEMPEIDDRVVSTRALERAYQYDTGNLVSRCG